jgi:hypothetical protein
MHKYTLLIIFLFFLSGSYAGKYRFLNLDSRHSGPALVIDEKALKAEGEKKANRISSQKWLYLWGAFVTAGTGTYFYFAARNHYLEYQVATTDATSLHNKIVTEDIIWPISFGLSAACFGMFLYKNAQAEKIRKKYNISVLPVQKGAVVSFCLHF